MVVAAAASSDMIALDDALRELEAINPRKSRLIELRYLGGLTAEEMAEVTGVATATIARDLKLAQAWLHRLLTPQAAGRS